MSLDEKIQLVTGYMGVPDGWTAENGDREFTFTPEMIPPPGAIGSDGFVPGIARLGIPDLHLVGAGMGITSLVARPNGEGVSFPSAMSQTATWNPGLIREFGRRLGRGARAQGMNVLLGAGANLAIEPRCGRAFEYHGEDPVLAGLMVREELLGAQEAGVVATVKHFAANFQETGRFVISSVVEERALREGELLAFELALEDTEVGAVMTAYNRVNGTYASENAYLLTTVLKEEWGFRGWVMSDWGAAHSTVESALAGLDQEFPHAHWFGSALRKAVESGEVPLSRLDDMNHRILRSLAAVGALDHRPRPSRDHDGDLAIAQQIQEEGIVLLKNAGALPIPVDYAGTIAVVGGHADAAVPSGGGSGSVRPLGGDPLARSGDGGLAQYWVPSSPLACLRRAFPNATVHFADGTDPADAVRLAQQSGYTFVFATQLTAEHSDVPDLSLPLAQDDLIAAVAATETSVVVVLETGGVVTMPWVDSVSAVLATWYPGHRGGEALAAIVSGGVNPSGRSPVTFPRREQDLPHQTVFPMPMLDGQTEEVPLSLVNMLTKQQGEYFDAVYDEGLRIGYKWYESQGIPVTFAFGHGLSYTSFEYRDAKAAWRSTGAEVTLTLRNSGEVAGKETVQVYAALPSTALAPRRLVAWQKVDLAAGESIMVTIPVPTKHLSVWSVPDQSWRLPEGEYVLDVSASSADTRLQVRVRPPAQDAKP